MSKPFSGLPRPEVHILESATEQPHVAIMHYEGVVAVRTSYDQKKLAKSAKHIAKFFHWRAAAMDGARLRDVEDDWVIIRLAPEGPPNEAGG